MNYDILGDFQICISVPLSKMSSKFENKKKTIEKRILTNE